MTSELREITEVNEDRTIFAVVGPLGGVHFWCKKYKDKFAGEDYYGGVEWHYGFRPSWGRDECQSGETCWLLDKPCWHTGSSCLASDTYIPAWQSCQIRGDFSYLFGLLRMAYEQLVEAAEEVQHVPLAFGNATLPAPSTN